MALVARNASARLREAVQKNDLGLVIRLRYKTELRNTDDKRLTSLAWAALCVSEQVYEWLLLDAGHDEDELSRDSENSTILHLLASLPNPLTSFGTCTGQHETDKSRIEIFQAAVRMSNMYWDVFPDLIDWSNAAGKTALHVASQSGNAELVQTLCELGADVQLTDLQGNTPIHYASAWNNLACIKILLSFGAASSARNKDYLTALDYAFSTTLAREFSLAIREAHEERKARRLASKASFTTTTTSEDAHGAYSMSGHGHGPPYGHAFNRYQTDPSTPPQFHITTPEPRSPTYSPYSNILGLGLVPDRSMAAYASSNPSTPSKKDEFPAHLSPSYSNRPSAYPASPTLAASPRPRTTKSPTLPPPSQPSSSSHTQSVQTLQDLRASQNDTPSPSPHSQSGSRRGGAKSPRPTIPALIIPDSSKSLQSANSSTRDPTDDRLRVQGALSPGVPGSAATTQEVVLPEHDLFVDSPTSMHSSVVPQATKETAPPATVALGKAL